MPIRSLVLLCLIAATAPAHAQAPGVPLAPAVYRLRSEILGEDRTILVQTPPATATMPAPMVVRLICNELADPSGVML